MKLFRLLLISSVALTATVQASQPRLVAGPMVGSAAMAEVQLWAQTDAAAEVRIKYWPVDNPDAIETTRPVTTRHEDGFVAHMVADRVHAGTRYHYSILLDNQQIILQDRDEATIQPAFQTPRNWRFRETGHEVFDFSIGFGSCSYINQAGGHDRLNSPPWGGEYHIFETVYEQQPDLFVWLGDSVYYREPDWTTRTGMIHRWSYDRSIPHLRGMLATIPQYAIWDDHDYGPNDAGREFWQRDLAREIFELFWANPGGGMPGGEDITGYFAWGDVHFYLLDNRSYRTIPDLEHPELSGRAAQKLGKSQIDWLVELMKFNRGQSDGSYPSTFHVVAVGSQMLSPYSADGLMSYREEWHYLFDRLIAENLHDVIFITGDVHFGEVNRLVLAPDGEQRRGTTGAEDFVFHEITSSSLTAGPAPAAASEDNPNRLDIFPGEIDHVAGRNFATLSFEGPLTDRRAVIRYFNADGQMLNQAPDAPEGTPTAESVIRARNPNLEPRPGPDT